MEVYEMDQFSRFANSEDVCHTMDANGDLPSWCNWYTGETWNPPILAFCGFQILSPAAGIVFPPKTHLSFPQTASSSFWAMVWCSGFLARHAIVVRIEEDVVSEPPSTRTPRKWLTCWSVILPAYSGWSKSRSPIQSRRSPWLRRLSKYTLAVAQVLSIAVNDFMARFRHWLMNPGRYLRKGNSSTGGLAPGSRDSLYYWAKPTKDVSYVNSNWIDGISDGYLPSPGHRIHT